MLVFGTTNWKWTAGEGEFSCPQCQRFQVYRIRARRPFLTIYFIPAVPLGPVERLVQCDACRHRFDVAILEPSSNDPETGIAEPDYHDELLRAAVLLVIAGGEIEEVEIQALQRVGTHVTGREVDREELGQICSSAVQNEVRVDDYLFSVMHRWSLAQQQRMLQTLFWVGSLDGQLDANASRLLRAWSERLQLSEREMAALIEEALAWELDPEEAEPTGPSLSELAGQ